MIRKTEQNLISRVDKAKEGFVDSSSISSSSIISFDGTGVSFRSIVSLGFVCWVIVQLWVGVHHEVTLILSLSYIYTVDKEITG
jgi:hypothetical protein